MAKSIGQSYFRNFEYRLNYKADSWMSDLDSPFFFKLSEDGCIEKVFFPSKMADIEIRMYLEEFGFSR